MKLCPICRLESRDSADWCWNCAYSFEEADARMQAVDAARGAGNIDDEAEESSSARRLDEPDSTDD